MKITIQDVLKKFGDTVIVNQANLTIESGEMFFLLGPSGCGKTTILRMLAGFYDPEGGKILFGEKSIVGTPPHQRNTALVFQNYAVWPHLTVFENVAYGLRVRKIKEPELRQRVEEALTQVRMIQYIDRKPSQLSGGQQQRVALARAFVVRPDLLLFDEPLCNLDAKLRIEMRDEIKRIHAATKITALYVTHDQEEALSLASRLAVMNQGIIQQVGTPFEIYNKPQNKFVAGFIGEMNFLANDTKLATRLGSKPGHILGFRPEYVQVQTNAEGNLIPAKVLLSTYLGSKNELVLKTADGDEIKAWTPGYYAEGASVFFTVPSEKLHHFAS